MSALKETMNISPSPREEVEAREVSLSDTPRELVIRRTEPAAPAVASAKLDVPPYVVQGKDSLAEAMKPKVASDNSGVRETAKVAKARVYWVPTGPELTYDHQKTIRERAVSSLGWYKEKLAERYAAVVLECVHLQYSRDEHNRVIASVSAEDLDKEKRMKKEFLEMRRKREDMIEEIEGDTMEHEREYKRMKISLEKHKEFRGLADKMYSVKPLDEK
ncbi:hypothetical protein BGX27_004386 [Mortierella sp. AM989]|nr:hypothetical protein BGX27_004386 [Mortierella sp. AM989]